jgi:Protein of unknown function (DUF3137)
MESFDIESSLKALEKERRTLLLRSIIPFVLAIGFSFLLRYVLQRFFNIGIVGTVFVFFFPLGFAYVMMAFITYPFMKKYKREIVSKYIESRFPSLTFSPRTHFHEIEICKSNMFISDGYNGLNRQGILATRLEGYKAQAELISLNVDDLRNNGKITASGDAGFNGLLVCLESDKPTVNDTDGGSNFVIMPRSRALAPNISTVILPILYDQRDESRGMYQPPECSILFKNGGKDIPEFANKMMNKIIPPEKLQALCLAKDLPDKIQLVWQASEEVQVEDKDFCENFVAYAKNQNGKNVVLNSFFRHKLLEIKNIQKKDFYFSLTGGKCYAAFSEWDNLFVPGIWTPVNSKTELRIKNEIENLISLINSATALAKAANY